MAGFHHPHYLIFLTHFHLFLLAAVSADDADVMSRLLAGISPTPSGWLSTTDYCQWKNVNCDGNKRVTLINLAKQSLTGTLPSDLNSLTQLQTLSLQSNGFSGELPSLSNLSSLRDVYLNNNNFTSVPTTPFAGLTSLQTISLSTNPSLSPWPFPSELTDSSSLVALFADNVNLVGPIPDVFSSFANLQNLTLAFNNLTGPLPSSFAGTQIQNLWLNNQAGKLTGPIDVLATMNLLQQVWLHTNAFTGPIPNLSNLTSLYDLQLSDNRLTGPVPRSLIDLPSLKNAEIRNNRLQGPYPAFNSSVTTKIAPLNSFCLGEDRPGAACDPQVTALIEVAGGFGYPYSLADSWKGNDPCGWPFVVCTSGNVTVVNLPKQGLNGSVSPAFASLVSLRTVDLSGNNLTGKIPEELTSLPRLEKLDLSYNNLSGDVPGFRPGVNVTTKGNAFIGTDVDTAGGKGGGSGSNSTGSGDGDGGSKKSSVNAGLVAGLVISVAVFVGVVAFVCYKCYIKKRKGVAGGFGRVQSPENGIKLVENHNIAGDDGAVNNGYMGMPNDIGSQSSGDYREMPPVFDGGNVVISIQVIRQVTNNFSEDNILGRGGFGIVYKGELHDGTKIAVKRMESTAMGTKGLNEFQAEIAVLTKVRHRHLVALLGYCINGNERLLVYEYMPQGTLGQHLFEWQELGYTVLTWKQRVTIALDVARGVEYLHSLARSSFIHRDLKPSNILLGDDMRAKVADFGLVKNAPDGKYSMETRLAGTFGYLAPEYAATGRVTTKVDVYAFGVILMEIMTGRKALDETMPEDRCHLVTWFRRILINKENIRKSIDPVLDPDEETYESILKVAELAGHCTAREPHQRPDMGHAVNVLGPLVEQWKPSCQGEEDSYGIDLHMSLPQALERWQADEGTSTMFDDVSFSRTQGSIPAKPSSFADTFNSNDCR